MFIFTSIKNWVSFEIFAIDVTTVSEKWGTFEARRKIIKDTYDRAIAQGDKNIYFVDGREIFKGEEWDAVTVDGTHPNDFSFYRFAQYLEKYLKPLLK